MVSGCRERAICLKQHLGLSIPTVMPLRILLPALCALGLLFPTAASAVEAGMVIGANTKVDEVAKTRESGAKWVRIFVDWSSFDEATNARRIKAYKKAGINVLVVVSYTPAAYRPAGTTKYHPPSNPARYGDFLAHLGRTLGPYIDAYEVWNEPDDSIHWHNGPRPAQYAPLLKEAYRGVKQTDPTATVVTGGMVGNNFDFLAALYKLGAKGHFDAVGVHTDLACESDPPEFQYRDPQGRIGRYVFTGYREVAATMADHGERKPIWMTEMGWPTPGAGVKCLQGGQPVRGKENEPGGVSYAKQAEYLRRGFECMQGDGLVSVAFWFSLQDISNQLTHEHRFGLIDTFGSHKPAYNALQRWVWDRGANRSCGEPVDRSAPSVNIQWPPDGFRFSGPLVIKASATDNLTVSRMQLFVNGKQVRGPVGDRIVIDPWWPARDLPAGDHRLVVKAFDGAKNVGQRAVTVRKVPANQAAATVRADLSLEARVRNGRNLSLCARVSAPQDAAIAPTGRVRVFVQVRRSGRWQRSTYLTGKSARGVCRTHRVASAGRWRIFAKHLAEAPYKRLTSKPVVIRVR
jgi:polysaccharide biosynthesis protein PslG